MDKVPFEADGKRILQARLSFGAARGKALSQAELGEMVGVGQKTVATWEQGRNRPGVDTYVKLAQVFGCTVDDLLGNPSGRAKPMENELTAPVRKSATKRRPA